MIQIVTEGGGMLNPTCPDGGEMTWILTEYGSLGEGGSYELWDCTVHGERWLQMPD